MSENRYRTQRTRDPRTAAAYLRDGHPVAFPTETVYGIGAGAFDDDGVRRIYAVKRRPADNPLIVHVSTIDQVVLLTSRIQPTAERLMERFFPGALTVVLPKHPTVPTVTTGGMDTVAVRMPADPTAHAFLEACGTPVAAPSANLSGRPSATSWQAVLEDLDGAIACILKGDPLITGLESTVVDCCGSVPQLLRPGAIALEDLEGVQLPPRQQTAKLPSPGTRYRHYAPNARVCIVEAPPRVLPNTKAAYIGLAPLEHEDQFTLARACASEEEYGRSLFAFFRQCEAHGVTHIFCQKVRMQGIGRAIMDRIQRASNASLKSN